ncbi:phospholipase [Aliidiomarina minuta]|uniref:Phospholipase A1 n=1 Tax=Aliidiomarina minuta TaxID=880057 RepID=A0A432W6Z2_9GAMM|nr:phospholipase A [Aliidiomarina minuta]RUO25837.1 phospholipase [Aliidiomarina minuta]
MPACKITVVSLFLVTSVSIAGQDEEHPEIIVPDIESRVEARVQAELESAENPYVITPHRPNYVLPAKFSTRRNESSFDDIPDSDIINSVEFKMQFSFKYPLTTSLFGSKHSIWFAYTQQSFWQAYNNQASRPFRETNYEPEVFIAFDLDFEVLGIDPKYLNISLNHQSNGRSEPTSRSWNRVMAEVIFEYDNLAFSVRPWWRIPESSDDDDNPDIYSYLGYGDLTAVYSWDQYSVDVMLRNNLHRSNNRGAIQVGFTFPLWNRFKGYVQYFNGYGESLVDYNYHNQSLGVGIILTSWL